jgi:hypothetical protein
MGKACKDRQAVGIGDMERFAHTPKTGKLERSHRHVRVCAQSKITE